MFDEGGAEPWAEELKRPSGNFYSELEGNFQSVDLSLPVEHHAPTPEPNSTEQQVTNSPLTSRILNYEIIEGQGERSFVVYIIESVEGALRFRVKRRYTDFVLLHKKLCEEYPAAILPPVPPKQRTDYLNRLEAQFILHRLRRLQFFLTHAITLSPSSDSLRAFLTSLYMPNESYSQRTSLFEDISDRIVNSFSKLKTRDERFELMKTAVGNSIEQLQTTLKIGSNISQHTAKLSKKLTQASLLLVELQPTIANIERLNEFGTKLQNAARFLPQSGNEIFFDLIKEHENYAKSARNVLKNRDHRQLDCEDLQQFLHNAYYEKEKIAESTSGHGEGFGAFFKKKFDEMKGLSPEEARQSRLHKVDLKIAELESAFENSKKVLSEFNSQLLLSYEQYQRSRAEDLKSALKSMVEHNAEYHRKALEVWSSK